jgi:hypothetical protein
VAFLLSCAGHWPPKYVVDGGCFHRAYYRLSLPVIPFFRAALFADALAGCLLFFGLAGLVSSSRYITGTYLDSNRLTVSDSSCFQLLEGLKLRNLSVFWKAEWRNNPKNNRSCPYRWQCGQ